MARGIPHPENLRQTGRPRRLTPKQILFVEHYLKTGKALTAAKAAGYQGNSKSLGAGLLKNPLIKEAIEAGQQRIVESLEKSALVTIERVIAGLLAEAEYHGQNASHGARVSAWSKLGEHIGMFANRQPGDDDTHGVKNLTDEQLKQRIELIERELGRTPGATH